MDKKVKAAEQRLQAMIMKMLWNDMKTITQRIANKVTLGVAFVKLTVEMAKLQNSKRVRALSPEDRALLYQDEVFMAEVEKATEAYGAVYRSVYGE